MNNYFIVTTFRKDLEFDNNFDNLLNEKLKLDNLKIDCEIVSGSYHGQIEYSLLISNHSLLGLRERNHVLKIVKKYFQETYLEISGCDAYLIDNRDLVILHGTWSKCSRDEAINNNDGYTYFHNKDEFYIIT